MSVLVSAAPLYLSIGTGLFSLYLYSTPAFRSLGSTRLTVFCFLVPFLLVVDSIIALVVLGTEDASFGLVRTEFVLQVLISLSLNLINALILHPNTLPLFLARPAFGYKFQIWAVTTITTLAICIAIVDAIASFSSVVPSMVSFVGVIVPPPFFALLLRVALVSRKWNSSPSSWSWDLLATLQLPALAISITRAWPTDTIASTVCHFGLFFWTTGTLISISSEFMDFTFLGRILTIAFPGELAPSPRAKSPKQYHVAPRRVQHTTVSEDFQSNCDPFAGPLGYQHRHHLPALPDVDAYDYGEEHPPHRKQGAIRTQYSSESSTQWLLAHPNVQCFPSFPPPVHLMPPAPHMPLDVGGSISLRPPVKPVPTTPTPLSQDRTPTQSLYMPGSPPKSVHRKSTEESSPPRETDSLPSTPSFELDTPDQTFSSDIDTTVHISMTDSSNPETTLDDVSSMMPVSSDIDEEKDLKQDGETPRLPSVLPP